MSYNQGVMIRSWSLLARSRPLSHAARQRLTKASKASGELLYGSDAVLSALQSGKRSQFHRLFLLDHANDAASAKAGRVREELLRLADNRQIPVEYLSRSEMDSLSRQRTNNGIMLDTEPIRPEVITSLPDPALSEHPPTWILLDQIVDPQNLGAILRSCSFFGIDGVVICGRNSAPLSATVAKASCGALEYVNLKLCHSMPRFLDGCHSQWNVIGMAVGHSSVPFKDAVKRFENSPLVLVVGSEGTGLRPLVRDKCHALAMIPKSPTAPAIIDSLNVSTALGIALHLLSAR